MNQNQNYDPGLVGWKSVVIGVVLLYFAFHDLLSNIKVSTNGPVPTVETKVPADQLAEAPKDNFGGLSEEERKEILETIQWESSDDFPLQGSADAKKGGRFRMAANNFPATLRTTGKNSSDAQIAMMEKLVYQTLISVNPDPFYYYPQLAHKWAIDEDKVTFYFEIDPDAKWSDGKPVVAYDVVATWDLLTDKGLQDPSTNEIWKKYERPVILDNRTVMVKAKEKHWRSFMTFGDSFFVFPGHLVGKISGKQYLKKYQWKMLPGSGPYKLSKVTKPRLISFNRREDFWGWSKRQFKGLFNFDTFEYMFVKDQELIWEKFKAGEFDFMPIYRSNRWVKETGFDKVQKGWIQKKKVFNRRPKGTQGFSFNIRRAPFDDKRVRKAFAYLWNRGLLMEKLMFNEYVYLDSYFQNSPYMSEKIPKIRYNPDKARELLKEAGWGERGPDGWLTKDGKVFEVTMSYVGKWSEKFYTVFKEDLQKVGIKLNLKEVTWATKIKEVNERTFEITTGAYIGVSFPNPETTYHSKFADRKNSGNRWGFKNDRVDELIEAYNQEYDFDKRVGYLKEMDEILANEHLISFDWYAPSERLIYWNRFGMPDEIISKTGDYRDTVSMWWFDKDRASSLKKAMGSGSSLDVEPVEIHPYDGK